MKSKYLIISIFILLFINVIATAPLIFAESLDSTETKYFTDVFYPPESELLKQGLTLESYKQSLIDTAPKNRSSSVDNIWGTSPLTGTIRIPVLLVQFSDRPGTLTQSHINTKFNDSTITTNSISVSKYFNKQSYGQLSVIYDVYNWTTMPQTFSYYSATSTTRFQLIIDAVNTFNSSVNFAQYDNDNDGRLDGMAVVFSGPSTGISPDIWPNTRILKNYNSNPVDGKYLGNTAMIPEKGVRGSNSFEIAVATHEFAHVLGLPDLYENAPTFSRNTGPMHQLTMMNFGENSCLYKPINLDAWSRYFLGWINPTVLTVDSPKEINLRSVNDYPDVVILKNNNMGSREFFIVENRYRNSSDIYNLDSCMFNNTSSTLGGFAIYHIEEGKIETDYPNNWVNWDPDGNYYNDDAWPGITVEENFVTSLLSFSLSAGDMYFIHPNLPGYFENFDENMYMYPGYMVYDMITRTYSGNPNPFIRFKALSGPNQYTMSAKALVGQETTTPTTTLSSGTYPMGTTVTLTSPTPSATIYYTTNGTTPTTSSSVYTGPVTLPSGTITFKAIAKKNDFYVSDILERNYVITNQTVATPTASQASGNVNYNSQVTLSTTTTGAIIRYTLDGSEPTESSSIYSTPFTITGTTNIKAKAYKTGWQPSATATFNYTVQTVATPTASQPSGNVNYNSQVSLSTTTTGAIIRYTLDGTEPTESSSIYSTPFTITGTTNIKAKAYKTGYQPSATATFNYTVQTVSTPTSSQASGNVNYNSQVSLSTTTTGATIRYTLDGTEPTESSSIYSTPFTITGTTNIKAKAYKTGWQSSATATFNYTVQTVATPTSSQPSGNVDYNSQVSLSTTTIGSTIRYTLDGTEPTETSNIYSTPFTITGTTNIKAKAYKQGYQPSATATFNYTVQTVATPTASQASGNVNYNSQVSLSTTTTGATIRYTLDGTEPTESSSIYSTPFTITGTTNIKAKAYKTGWQPSSTATFNYTIQTVATPTASQASGNVNYNSQVSLSTTTPGATIRYTLNGSEPTESSSIYSTPFTITGTTNIKAKAYKQGYQPSSTASFNYTVQTVATPTASQASGNVNYNSQVSLSTTTTGATIRYTLDGTEPTESSSIYSTPFTITGTTNIKAKAYKTGWEPSSTATFNYTINAVAIPTASQASGNVNYNSEVTLSTTTTGATIRYTLNGTEPTESSSIYSTPFTITGTTNIKAKAYKTGYQPSATATFNYTVQTVATPTASQASGNVNYNSEVSLSTTTTGATIRYTLDGTEPTESSSIYSTPFTITGTTNIKAKAYKTGYQPSATATFNYTVQTVIIPTASQASGNVNYNSQVTLSTTTTGATIRYTLDGSEPTESSSIYSTPFTITGATNIKAKAYRTGWQPSATASFNYTVNAVAIPTASQASGNVNYNSQVILSTTTTGATIRYTLDGTEPTESSSIYSTPFTITGTTNIKAKAYKQGYQPSATASFNYTINAVAIPTASQASGTVNYNSEVSLSTTTSGATIRYTLDNSEPTESSSIYSTPFTITGTTNIKAKAYKTGWQPSVIVSFNYTVQTVATPTASQASGNVNYNSQVILSTTTTGATIRYTLDGTEPTESSSIYSTPFTITGTTNIKAKAYKTGWQPSVIVSFNYTVQTVATPTASQASGNVNYNSQVILSTTTTGATIRYTLDGTEPTESSSIYSTPFTITGTTNIKAKAYKTGYQPSSTATFNYTINAVAIPTASQASGNVNYNSEVTLSTTTSGATIRYTLDNSEPTESSSIYSTPFTITGTTNIKAKAYKTGYQPSATATFNYTVQTVATPTASQASGNVNYNSQVSLSTTTSGATIRYTLDGTEPTESSSIYSTPFTITGTTNIKAKAYKTGWEPSAIATFNYTVQTVATPTASQASGNVNYNSQVILSTTTTGATIRYTLDGTEPTESSSIYSTPFTITGTTNIKAKAYKTGWQPSVIVSFNYTVQTVATPTASQASGNVNYNSQVILSTTTTGATIRYTLDGTEPTESSSIYSTPFTITGTTNIKAKAYKTGYQPSATATFNYTIQTVSTPTSSQPSGNVNYNSQVILSTTTSGATIRYTLDGTEPTESSSIYSTPFTITGTTNIKAKAYKTGWQPSSTATFNYTINAVATPTASQASGNVNYNSEVSLSTTTTGATIRYTLDGTEPTESSSIYSTPFTITGTTNIKAKAYKTGWQPSATASFNYTVNAVAIPTASQASGNVNYNSQVILSTTTTGATIRYTLDGTEPTESSSIYSTPFTITGTTNIKAKAYRTGWEPSAIASFNYTVQTVATPTASQASGNVNYNSEVTLSTTTTGATIRYTLDGTEPTENSSIYSTPFTITGTTNIKAKAYKTGWESSATATFNYSVLTVEPVVSTLDSGYYFYGTTMALYTPTVGASIRYTTNGTDPTETSTLYTGPIAIISNFTLKARAFKQGFVPSNISTYNYSTGAAPENLIIDFTLQGIDSETVIDNDQNQIIIIAPYGTYKNGLIPIIQVEEGCSVYPESGIPQNFINSVNYTVSSITGQRTYTVTVTNAPRVLAPVASVTGGNFTEPITLELTTLTPGAVIKYTTNGSIPTLTSNTYNSPITISSTTTIRAKAYLYTGPGFISNSSKQNTGRNIPNLIPTAVIWHGSSILTEEYIFTRKINKLEKKEKETKETIQKEKTQQIISSEKDLKN